MTDHRAVVRPSKPRWRRAVHLAVASAVLFATGCTAYGYDCSGSEPAYDLCLPGNYCAAGTNCIDANTSAQGRSGAVYSFCSATCAQDTDCPQPGGGATAVCLMPSGTGGGVCYARCDAGDGQCLGGFTCTPEGAHRLCIPSETVDYYSVCDNSGDVYYGP